MRCWPPNRTRWGCWASTRLAGANGSGKPAPDTGKRSWADRFDTGQVDITGTQGLLAQVNGRTAKVVTEWLDQRGEAWRARITRYAGGPCQGASC